MSQPNGSKLIYRVTVVRQLVVPTKAREASQNFEKPFQLQFRSHSETLCVISKVLPLLQLLRKEGMWIVCHLSLLQIEQSV